MRKFLLYLIPLCIISTNVFAYLNVTSLNTTVILSKNTSAEVVETLIVNMSNSSIGQYLQDRRGSGSRGGVGRAGKKHKFTRIVKYEKDRLRKKGFAPWMKVKMGVMNLDDVSKAAQDKNEVELAGYKVLGGGLLSRSINVKASGFSKKAMEKIKQAGGQATKL